jgi:hypothetical protein
MTILQQLVNILEEDVSILNSNKSEDNIKTAMYHPLLSKVTEILENHYNVSKKNSRNKAKKNLLWEGNKNTTVSNTLFLGAFHRPDMVVNFKDFNVAIEVKKGDRGSSIREGLGQSLVYSNSYDFTIYFFLDTSKEKRIVNASKSEDESMLIATLWQNHNVIFRVA